MRNHAVRIVTALALGVLGVSPGAAYGQRGWAPPGSHADEKPGEAARLLDELARAADAATRAALASKLQHQPLSALRACFEQAAATSPPDPVRIAMIDALGRCGLEADLDLAFRVAVAGREASSDDPVARALESAVASLLQRDAAGYARLDTLLGSAPEALRNPLLRAASDADLARGLKLFARLAEREGSLGALAVSHIARAGARAPRPVAEEVASVVRRRLGDSRSGVLAEAALAAGRVEDSRSVPRLIELLSDPRRGVRANAEWALRAISGLDLHGGEKGWLAWHRAEEGWRKDAWPQVAQDLQSGDKARMVPALAAVARRQCFPHELARCVIAVLDHPDPELQILACDVLRHLGSTVAIQPLVSCASSTDPAVAAAARRALLAISGKDRGTHPAPRLTP